MAVHTVVGGQFGSEAKGHVAHQLITRADESGRTVCAVRVGGPNAGHTVCLPDGTPIALRTLPVGAATPGVLCVIAQGSEIDPRVLEHEILLMESHGYSIRDRLIIDRNATIITEDHIATESTGDINARTGSTAKGIGAARADRAMRLAPIVRDDSWFAQWGDVDDTVYLLNTWSNRPTASVVIEGTQGYGLGLHTRFYPQTTSGNCRSVDLLAQCGIHPPSTYKFHTWVVYRPFPIRVAGNSGPLHAETTWDALRENNPAIPTERTTVTKKVRRVGEWDLALALESWRANGGGFASNTHTCLMFADYICPTLTGLYGDRTRLNLNYRDMLPIIELEEQMNTQFDIIGTSPSTVIYNSEVVL